MNLGLKRGTVKLFEHEKEWEVEAQNTIFRLREILGDVVKDIQHVGSTAIPSIKAKPIIDIVIAVDDFNDVLAFEKELKLAGFYYRPQAEQKGQLLFASGNFYEGTGDLQTHFIHVVLAHSMEWINYINFRDYLNANTVVAKEYERLKESLALQNSFDGGRENYTNGKHDFIVYTLRKALVKSYLGKTVNIKIDRPIGYVHKKEKYSLTYPINYGFIPGVLGGDGEELDVYLLGVDKPVTEYTAKVIGIAHREDDIEDKLIAVPQNMKFTKNEIEKAIHFQEQYYKTTVEIIDTNFENVKQILTNDDILELLVPSVYKPTKEKMLNRALKYQQNDNIHIYAYKDDEYKGIVVFEIADNIATIWDIAVKPEYQGQGIGSKLIDFIFNSFNVNNITAETDDDAIGFYKKYGFTVADTKVEFDTKRYVCVCESVTHHYDLLIEENNDPVHDSKPLQDYMDKWDGQAFIDKMELDKDKTVLEIGVGTGRLAVRVAPFCGEFYGVDLSTKTIERATENLAEFENVRLACADFLSYEFGRAFDVVYSSLTFMHIEDKQRAVNKISGLLNDAGRFVLSIDKNPSEFIDTGTRKIRIFPDTPVEMAECIRTAGLTILNQYDTEFATIFVAQKG